MVIKMRKILLRRCFLLTLLCLAAACAAQEELPTTRMYKKSLLGQTGFDVYVREAEEPTKTVRPLENTLPLRTEELKQLEEAQEGEGTAAKMPALRRKRIQLRRNRYLLLQDS